MGATGLTLFALPFAGAGLFVLYLGLSTLYDWQSMRDWEAVPAEIRSVRLAMHSGDDGATYKVNASYEYEYLGVEYSGSRVAVNSSADNIGSFQHRLYRKLKAAKQAGQPYTAFVNPCDPSQAVLNRDLRGGLLTLMLGLGSVFSGAGLGLLVFARFTAARQRERNALEQQHPGQPWKWRSNWRAGRIEGSGRTQMWFATAFALIWNLISFPLVLVIPDEIVTGGNYFALLGLLFPLIGAGLGIWAIRTVRALPRVRSISTPARNAAGIHRR